MKVDPEEKLPEVQNMLYKLAHRFANKYPIEFEDALSEAYVAFMSASRRFDPEAGVKFSTWCYRIVSLEMQGVIQKRSSEPRQCELNEEIAGEAKPESGEVMELMEDLSQDAREIVSLLLDPPTELIQHGPIPIHALCKRVKKWLLRQGKHKPDLEEAHQEIKRKVQTRWTLDDVRADLRLTPSRVQELLNYDRA